MGLTSWKGAKVRKGDVVVAKNYLNEKEASQKSTGTKLVLISTRTNNICRANIMSLLMAYICV